MEMLSNSVIFQSQTLNILTNFIFYKNYHPAKKLFKI